MSDNLTQVMLEFSANFDSFDATLRRAENRAKTAGQNIEKALKVKSGVIDPGGRSVVTGRAPTQASQQPAKTIVGFSRGVDPSVAKESSKSREQADRLAKYSLQSQQKLAQQQISAIKSANQANIFNQLKSLVVSRTVAPTIDKASSFVVGLANDTLNAAADSFKSFADELSVVLGAQVRAGGDLSERSIADALSRGASDGVSEIARVFGRELLESLGIFKAERGVEKRIADTGAPGQKQMRALVANAIEQSNLTAEIRQLSAKQGVAKKAVAKFEKTDEYQQAAAVIREMEQDRDALLEEMRDFASNTFDYGTAEYTQNIASLERLSKAVDKANARIESRMKSNPALVKRAGLVANYEGATKDTLRAKTRLGATKVFEQEAYKDLGKSSFQSLAQARDLLVVAVKEASKELSEIKVPKDALVNLDALAVRQAKLEKSIALGSDQQGSYSRDIKEAKTGINALESQGSLSSEETAILVLAKKELAKLEKGAKISAAKLKKSKQELAQVEDSIADLAAVVGQSGYIQAEEKVRLLSTELKHLRTVISDRTLSQYPKLLQEIAKELNLRVEDLDQLPKIRALSKEESIRGNAQYTSGDNTIGVNGDMLGELQKGLADASVDFVQTLSHELTHAIQTSFGKVDLRAIAEGSAKAKLVVNKKSITNSEVSAIAPKLAKYQGQGANVLEYETDAHISGRRVAVKAINKQRAKDAPNKMKEATSGLLQTQKTIEDMVKMLRVESEGYGDLLEHLRDGTNKVAKDALAKSKGYAERASVEVDLNADGVVASLESDLREIEEFKKTLKTKLAAVITSSKDLEKQEELQKKKDSIRSRIGQGVKNKLAFQTTVTPYNRENRGNQLALASSKAVGGALLEATKDIYQLASGAEAAALTFFPFGKQLKTVTQVLGATAIAASVPGSGLLLEGAQAVLAPAIDLAATGISGMVGGAVEGAIVSASGIISGAIAESGVIGAASIAGALTSAGATIAASAGTAAAGVAGVGAAGALTAGAVAIPTVAAVKGVNNGINNIMGDTTKAKANGERVAKNLGLLASAVNENFLATKSQLKSLAPAKGADKLQLQASYSKQVFLLKGQIAASEEALSEAEGDKTATRLIKETRKKLLGMLKTRQSQATAAGVEIVDTMPNEPKMKKVRQVTVVDEAINAGKKGAKLAKDFSDGFSQTIDATTDFWDSAEAGANRAVKGFAKGQDSASPSKKMQRLAKDFRDGFVLSVDKGNGFFNAARDAAKSAIAGFNKPLEATPDAALGFTDRIKATLANGLGSLTTFTSALGKSVNQSFYNGLATVGLGQKDVFQDAEVTFQNASNKIDKITQQLDRAEAQIDAFDALSIEDVDVTKQTKPGKAQAKAVKLGQAVVTGNSGQVGEVVGEGLGEAKKALSSLMSQLRLPGSGFGEFFRGIDKGFKATGAGATKLKLQIGALLTVGAFMILKNQIMSVGKALFNAALEMEVIQKKLNSVNMGGQDPFKAFGASANKAGLSVKDYASNFAGMVQTMNRSVPNADRVFESITEGLNKRGVVGDAMTRSMEAISQISSKGVVSMEELRQQLGEALPGAMTIAADSMGMTNGQFLKMVESGELLSSDFLPKFGMALNNVAGGDLPSLNTELQTAKNTIDGILAQSASTIPFTGALQSFNAVVSQSSDFLKILVPIIGVALVGAVVAAAGVIISTMPVVGAAFAAALPAAAWVAGIASAMTAMVEFVKYLKGAGTEFDKIGEKMEKALNPDVAKKSRLAATGTIARLNDSLTSFFTPGQSSKFAEKETIQVRQQANRQIQKQQDSINKSARKLTEGNINQTNKQVSPLVIEKQKLQIKLSNADALGLSQDAKKNITESINDIDAEIKGIVEKNLGSEIDVNTTLKATTESKAALEADAKARGEDVAVLYRAQYQNLVKQEQVLKSMVAQFAAVAGFSNNQIKAQKEMNSLLGLGTKVSEKDGVMETLAAYKELESLTTTMAGFDSASMVIDIAVKEGAVKEIEAQISSIDAFVSTSMGTAQEQVINKAFKNGWKKATAKEIADFKVQIESGALGEVDKAVVTMVESLEKKSDLEKELGQTNIDLIKANRQLEQALLDLNDARLNQQMQGNQTEMSLIQLAADLQKMSPENSKEVFDAGNSNIDFRLQQQESLRNLSVSFRSFGESLTDAADNLKSGIASMNEEIRATAASLKTTALNGATAFANAAGIEDTLGLGRLLDLASEKINIKASDKTASIERQQASENKTDKRQIRDFTEQREGLNREADRASMEIVRAIENNNFDMKDLEVNFELSGIQLQDKLDAAVRDVTGLERSTNEFNDRALGFGQAPVDVDISSLKNRLSQIQTMVTEGADSGAIVQALYDLKVQQNADAQEFLSGIQATKVQGNQGLTQKINDITALNKEKNVAFESQKGMEKERVELELDINDEKFQGTLVDIKRKLKEAGLTAVRSAEGVGLAINDKLATVGLAANPYELLRMESKRWKRDTLADIDAQQKALKNTLDMLGEGGNTADNKLNVQANLNNSNLDAETKDSLLGQLASVKTSEEFEAYIKSVKDSLASLETSEKQVLSNADEIEARAIKLAKAKDLLAKNNTLTGEKQSFLDSVDTSRLSGGEERELELAKKKLKINQDYANKIAQIDEDAMMNPNEYGGDVQKNRKNMALEEQANLLKKAQKEASILNDIYANMSSAGVDAIKTAILGIGEAILTNKPKQEEQDKLDADYAERLSSLVDGYTGSAEELQYAKDQLDNQRDDIQDDIESKLSKTAQIFDVLKGALSGFAQSIAQVAAQMAATAAIKGIAGAFGGGGWGSLASSLIGGANMGGHAGVDVISNYAMGGTAGIADALALQAGIGKAMQKEGQGAMPIVVHKGEQILSTRNGDAQLFRALKAQGEWDNIKQANVSNYANGGTAGYSGATGGGSMMRRGMAGNSNTYYSSNVTVVANDIGSFKKNEQQLMRETEAAQTRSVRRGLG